MTRRLIAAITAAALALGPMGATTASALDRKDRNALALILGAATLGIIIHENNKDKKKAAKIVSRNNQKHHRHYDDDKHRHKKHKGHYGYREQNRHAVVPAECVFPIRVRDGRRNVVSERCLTETRSARRLPKECSFQIRDQWGGRTVYGARCLKDRGWQIANVR